MDLKSLLQDTYRDTAENAARFIINNPEYFEEMLKMALGDDQKMAMRSSRVINLCYEMYPTLVQPYKVLIIHKLKDLKHESAKRNLLRIYIGNTQFLDENSLGLLIDNCFKFLESNSTEIAVKVYSLEIVFEVAQYIPALKSVLRDIIELQYNTSSAAFKSRANKMLKKLNKDLA